MLSNYQYWTCWDSCLWTNQKSCDEECLEENKRPRPSDLEQQEKSQKLKDMYRPIFATYQDNQSKNGWIQFSRGYSHPYFLEDNLHVDYKFTNGFLSYFQQLEIVSPLNENDGGKIIVIKEMMFPESWVFLVVVTGIFGSFGYRMIKNKGPK